MSGTITAGWVSANLTLTSAQACTVFAAYRCTARGAPSGRQGNGIVEIGAGNYFWIGGCQVIGNQTGNNGANPDPDGSCVFSMSVAPSGIVQRLNGLELFNTGLSLGAGGTSALSIAGFFDNGNYAWGGEWYGAAIYDRVLSAWEIQAVEGRFRDEWPAFGPRVDRPLIAWDGDSIPAGSKATLSANQAPDIVLATLGTANYYSRNLCTPGIATATCTTNAPTRIDPYYDGARTKNVLIFHEMTNEIVAGSSASTVYNNYKVYGNARKAAGWKVVLLDCLPRSIFSGAQETVRTTANASLAADFSTPTASSYVFRPGVGGTYADALVKVSTVPNLTNPANATYYEDGTHLTDAGYVDYAAAVAAAVPVV